MDTLQKLALLNDNVPLEVDAAAEQGCAGFADGRKADALDNSITTVLRSDGKRLTVLKTMLSSFCARNCYYCPWRRGRDLPRTQFAPEELAAAFVQMHGKRLVEGLFLSSGIHGRAAWTMDRLIAVGELLRRKHGFTGYIHLKIMPGAEKAQVERAMQLGQRMGGHIVTGHVDCIGKLVRSSEADRNRVLEFTLPAENARYLITKGSVAINGISLTVNTVTASGFSVNIIPLTQVATTLSGLAPGDEVNIETDIIGKYVERLARPWSGAGGVTLKSLAENGFL